MFRVEKRLESFRFVVVVVVVLQIAFRLTHADSLSGVNSFIYGLSTGKIASHHSNLHADQCKQYS